MYAKYMDRILIMFEDNFYHIKVRKKEGVFVIKSIYKSPITYLEKS